MGIQQLNLLEKAAVRFTRIIVIGWLLSAAPAYALPQVTKAQGDACYPDAMRLCGAPAAWGSVGALEHAKIIGCMIYHKNDVSQRCKDAFSAPARPERAPSRAPRRRAAPKRKGR